MSKMSKINAKKTFTLIFIAILYSLKKSLAKYYLKSVYNRCGQCRCLVDIC